MKGPCSASSHRPLRSLMAWTPAFLVASLCLPRCASVAYHVLPKPSTLRTESDVRRNAGETVTLGDLLDARAVRVSFVRPEIQIRIVGRFECIRSTKEETFRVQHEVRSLPRPAFALLAAETVVALVGGVGLGKLASNSVVSETEATVYTLSLPFIPILGVDLAALAFTRHSRSPSFETKISEDLREIERHPCTEEQAVSGWDAELGRRSVRTDAQGVAAFHSDALSADALLPDHVVPVFLESRGKRVHIPFAVPDEWLAPAIALQPRADPEAPSLEEGAPPLKVQVDVSNLGLLPLKDLVLEVSGPVNNTFIRHPGPAHIAEIAPGKTLIVDLEFKSDQPFTQDVEIAYSAMVRRSNGQTLAVAPITLRAIRRKLPVFRAAIRRPSGRPMPSSKQEAELLIDITNDGHGTARNVKIEIVDPAHRSSSHFGLSKNPFDTIGDLAPGRSAPARFFLRAGRELPAGGLPIRIRETGVPRAVETIMDVQMDGSQP